MDFVGGLRAGGDRHRRDLVGEGRTGRDFWSRWEFKGAYGNFLEPMRVTLVRVPSNGVMEPELAIFCS